jgi:hypothetical protein
MLRAQPLVVGPSVVWRQPAPGRAAVRAPVYAPAKEREPAWIQYWVQHWVE